MTLVRDALDRELVVTFVRERLRVVLLVDELVAVPLNLTKALELRGELDAAIGELVAVANADPSRRTPE